MSNGYLKQRSHLHDWPYYSLIVVRAQQSFKQLSLDDDVLPTPNFPSASVTTYATHFLVVSEMRRGVIGDVRLLGTSIGKVLFDSEESKRLIKRSDDIRCQVDFYWQLNSRSENLLVPIISRGAWIALKFIDGSVIDLWILIRLSPVFPGIECVHSSSKMFSWQSGPLCCSDSTSALNRLRESWGVLAGCVTKFTCLPFAHHAQLTPAHWRWNFSRTWTCNLYAII